jgi:hypothetical protein
MSIFDLIGSIAWGFSSMPQPTSFAFGDFHGASGTDFHPRLRRHLVSDNLLHICTDIPSNYCDLSNDVTGLLVRTETERQSKEVDLSGIHEKEPEKYEYTAEARCQRRQPGADQTKSIQEAVV